MLQCTAFTELPEMAARVAFMGLEDGIDLATDVPGLDEFLLCELGEHEEGAEHAAQLWSASPAAGRDLWMFWTEDGGRRKFRFVELLPCPAVLHRLSVKEGDVCVLYDRHPAAHSWDVTDPLADLMTEQIREEVRREREGGGGGFGGGGARGGRP